MQHELIMLVVALVIISLILMRRISKLKNYLDILNCTEKTLIETIKSLRKKINNMTRAKGYIERDTWSFQKGNSKLIEVKKGKWK